MELQRGDANAKTRAHRVGRHESNRLALAVSARAGNDRDFARPEHELVADLAPRRADARFRPSSSEQGCDRLGIVTGAMQFFRVAWLGCFNSGSDGGTAHAMRQAGIDALGARFRRQWQGDHGTAFRA